jgi:hypothetical protein
MNMPDAGASLVPCEGGRAAQRVRGSSTSAQILRGSARPDRASRLLDGQRMGAIEAHRALRVTAGALASLVALNAIVGGTLLAIAPSGRLLGMDRVLLQGTPFGGYRLIGLLLLGVIGGLMTCAALAQLRPWRSGPRWTVLAGVALVLWMAVQLALIGARSPMQAVLLGCGIALVALGVLQARATR